MTAPDDEEIMDADIQDLPRRSWFGGFVRGTLMGSVLAVLGFVAWSVTAPVPPHLPSGPSVEVIGAPEVPESALVPEVAAADPEPDAQTDPEPEAPAPATLTPSTPEASAAGTSSAAPAAHVAPDSAPPTDLPGQADAPDAAPIEAETPPRAATPAPSVVPGGAPPEGTPAAVDDAPAEVAAASQAPTAPDAPSAPAPADTPAAAPTAPALPELELALAGPALEVNARPFQASADAPLLAIVLTGATPASLTPEVLTALSSIPMTFAIPANGVATSFAEMIREGGHEILAELSGISAETPLDGEGAEQGLARALATMPGAVGATGPAGAQLMADRQVLESLVGQLGTHGFAFVDLRTVIDRSVESLAEREGVAFVRSSRVVRAGSDAAQITQLLQIAARQAQRDGSAVIAIPANAAALQAIVPWALGGSAQVRLAPISAVVARRR